ncbi:CIA30 family protein [Mycobacterium sp. M26]|uniref:CIA30 family protein n=1 Tax=Mycobacterium sp. M26 TaxID=1762962 RepID=UPI00073F4E0A|nr:CIA30 family protein [Mycobacterium sp. M26]
MGNYHHRRWSWTGVAIACLAILIMSGVNLGPIARADEPAVLVDLSDRNAVAAWTTVNDPVMGGRSTSSVSFGDGGLVFAGNISLENNGGFASARGPVDPEIGTRASGATALSVRALGDGKTYVLKVETGQPWSYIQRFSTDAGARRAYELPIAGFESVGMFLNPVPAPPLDPSTINRVGIYILDKQEGPFQLVVSVIDSSR